MRAQEAPPFTSKEIHGANKIHQCLPRGLFRVSTGHPAFPCGSRARATETSPEPGSVSHLIKVRGIARGLLSRSAKQPTIRSRLACILTSAWLERAIGAHLPY